MNAWMFTSRISNTYSMLMFNAVVYHRFDFALFNVV